MSDIDLNWDTEDFEAQERAEARERYRQLKHFDNKFVCISCTSTKPPCKRKTICYFCGIQFNPCECDSCIKIKYPCVHYKFPCNCNICKRIPDSQVIPKSLPIFRQLDLWVNYKYQTNHHFYPETAKFSTTTLRKEIIGSSAIATHYAQNRFSDSYLKNLGVEKNLKTEFNRSGLLPNFDGNLKAWEEHKSITSDVEKFRKRYHRFPPCFRERMDIRSVTKVNFIFEEINFIKIFEFFTFHKYRFFQKQQHNSGGPKGGYIGCFFSPTVPIAYAIDTDDEDIDDSSEDSESGETETLDESEISSSDDGKFIFVIYYSIFKCKIIISFHDIFRCQCG